MHSSGKTGFAHFRRRELGGRGARVQVRRGNRHQSDLPLLTGEVKMSPTMFIIFFAILGVGQTIIVNFNRLIKQLNTSNNEIHRQIQIVILNIL